MKDKRKNRTSENLESLMEKYRRRTQKILPEKRVFESIKDFIEAHQGLVKHIAKNYMGRGISLSELIKAGNMGLKNFTGKNERKFKMSMEMGKQYKMMGPSWWIRQAITRAIIEKTKTIRVPVHMMEFYNRVIRASSEMTQQLGREPTNEEIASKLGVPTRKVEGVLKIMQVQLHLIR